MLRALHYPSSLAATSSLPLVHGSDGKLYVIKRGDTVTARRAAATEMIASALAAAAEVPVPRATLIDVPAQLATSDPRQGMHSDGPHLAIEYAAQPPTGRCFDFFPATRLPLVANFHAFITAAAFDAWIQRRKPRQAVFVRVRPEEKYRVSFINQRSSFNAGTWRLTEDIMPAW